MKILAIVSLQLLVLLSLLAAVPPTAAQTNVVVNVADAGFWGTAGATKTIINLGAGQPAATAVRISVPTTTANLWDNGLGIDTTYTTNVPQGHWLLLKFSVRQVAGQANFATGIRGNLQVRSDAGQGGNSLDCNYPCDSANWCNYSLPIQAADAYSNASPAKLYFQLNEGPQTFDIAVTSLTYYGATKPATSLHSFYYPGRGDASAAWRTAANARIESVRKADLNVKVVDANNNPISGATVAVQQQRHEFRFGTAVDHWLVAGGSNPTYNQRIVQYFNHITLENGLKWVAWESDNGTSAVAALQWAAANNLSVTGHNLLWARFNYNYYMPEDTWTMTAAQLRPRILNHVASIIARTKAYVSEWDVINEPLDNFDVQGLVPSTNVQQTNGVLGNAFSAELFNYTYTQLRSAANPSPNLFVNDYSVIEGLDVTRRIYTANFTKYIKQRSPYVTGYGFQAHVSQYIIPINELQARFDYLMGVDPAFKADISELDIATADEQLQADYLEDFITFFFSQPKILHITQWGFWEGAHYCPICALWRQNWDAKPAGSRFLDLVYNRWWTSASTTTSSAGTAAVRAFYGRHRVTASLNGVSKSVDVNLVSTGANGQVVIQLNTVAPATSASASPPTSASPSSTRSPAAASPSRSPMASPSRSPAAASPSPSRSPAASSPSPSRSPAASPSRSPAAASPSPSPSVSTITTTGPHALSTYAATPGSTITVTTRVNVGSTPVNGFVGYHIAPAGDYSDQNTIATEATSVVLAARTTTTFSFSATLDSNAAPGQYWLTVAVWDASWNNIAWDTNLATLTVYPPEPTIDPLGVWPSSVLPGAQIQVNFTLNLAATAYAGAFVGYSFAPRGQWDNKLVEQFDWGTSGNGVNLAARSVRKYSFTTTVPSNAAPGSYDLNIGAWDSAWNTIVFSAGADSGAVLVVRSS